jgi:hypothetical protein
MQISIFALEVSGCYGRSMTVMRPLVPIEVNGCYRKQTFTFEEIVCYGTSMLLCKVNGYYGCHTFLWEVDECSVCKKSSVALKVKGSYGIVMCLLWKSVVAMESQRHWTRCSM